jgi:UPF0716 protein FxsA
MKKIPILPLLVIGLPLCELYLLIRLGSALGAFLTIFLLVFSSVLGLLLLQQQGLAMALRTQQAMARGESPSLNMLESLLIVVAGAALVFPGFLTDILGFALLIPWVRRRVIALMVKPPNPSPNSNQEARISPQGYIEGEFRREDD